MEDLQVLKQGVCLALAIRSTPCEDNNDAYRF